MGTRSGNDPLEEAHHHELNPYTTSYPHSLRTRGQTSPYTPNRATTLAGLSSPSLQRRPAIPEEFRMTQPEPPTTSPSTGMPDDIIDTAIVIKNIPFTYPEDSFLNKLFPDLNLTPPYAFNYHRNRTDGSFHGLAFANFTNPNEALEAVNVLNNFELERRRLRVELKKRLSPEEEQRQRIERQARRQVQGQQEQQSPSQISGQIRDSQQGVGPPLPLAAQTAPSTSSERRLESLSVLDVHNLPESLRPRVVFREPSSPTFGVDLDMNDEQTLGFYTTIQVFLSQYASTPTAALEFPSILTAQQRRIVRSLAQKYNLDTASYGTGSERYITVFKSGTQGTQRVTTSRLTVPAAEPSSIPENRPFPTSRASTDQLSALSPQTSQNTLRSPLSSSSVGATSTEQPRLRSVASMGNLRSQREGRRTEHAPPPPVPPIPYELFNPSYDLVYDPSPSSSRGLVHRTSAESTGSSRFPFQAQGQAPSRQPHGPPQDQARGFTQAIRPIGHGAKTSSHGSLSHGSGASQSGSRGGSDAITELAVPRGDSTHSQQ